MKVFRAIKTAGLILLGVMEIIAVVWLWKLLIPLPPMPGSPTVAPTYFFPVSQWWLYGACVIAAILGISILLSASRLRQLTILSCCFALLIAVAWLRSYSGVYYCYLNDDRWFPDHYLRHAYQVKTSDGGVCFTYHESEIWMNQSEQTNEVLATSGFHLQVTTASRLSYPGWGRAAVWKDSLLDKMGINLWAHDVGKIGVGYPSYVYLRGITVPYWLLVVVCLAAPIAYSAKSYRNWRRGRLGICSCGYQLRGNTSGTCPECGRIIPQRKEIVKPPDAAKPVA